MIDKNQVTRLVEFLSASKRLFFIFASTQQLDLLLAIIASYLFFKDLTLLNDSKIKLEEVAIFSPARSNSAFRNWPKIESYLQKHQLLNLSKHELGRENLLISFPYQQDQVDRVSYQISDDNKYFYLTIKPKKGSSPLDSQQVKFNYVGASADLLILVGVNDLTDLKELYGSHEELYQNTPIITINNFIPDFGNLNLDISGGSSYGEAVFYLLKNLINVLEFEWSDLAHLNQICTLLLTSIALKSKQFTSSNMTADSFLAVAELLQLGADRSLAELTPDLKPSKPKSKKVGKKKQAKKKANNS